MMQLIRISESQLAGEIESNDSSDDRIRIAANDDGAITRPLIKHIHARIFK